MFVCFLNFLFSIGEELINNVVRDFPGPVVKTLSSGCKGPGFEPQSGNSIPYASITTRHSQRNKTQQCCEFPVDSQGAQPHTCMHASIPPQTLLPGWPGSPSPAPCSGPDKPQLYQELSKRFPPHEQEGGGKLLNSDSTWRIDSARPPLSPPDSSP